MHHGIVCARGDVIARCVENWQFNACRSVFNKDVSSTARFSTAEFRGPDGEDPAVVQQMVFYL